MRVGFEAGAGWNRDRLDRSIGSASGLFTEPMLESELREQLRARYGL